MREEKKRLIITLAAALTWGLSVVLALLIVYRQEISADWNAAVLILVGAAVTLTLFRVMRSTRHVLAQVYRAGEAQAQCHVDNVSAQSFQAGVIAGREWSRHGNGNGEPAVDNPVNG